MKSSKQRILHTALLIAFAITVVPRANAQALTFAGASPNATQTSLGIIGTNFCAAPAVTLAGTALAVQSATPTLVTATLAAPYAYGTYYLVVSCGTLAGRTVTGNVTLGTPPRSAAAG